MTFLKQRLLWVLVFALMMYVSCKKSDQQFIKTADQAEQEERFFNEHRSNDPVEKTLVDFAVRRNQKDHYVATTIERIGFPYWDKSVKIARNGTSGPVTFYYVPFVRDKQDHVNAAMVLKTTATDTSLYYMCDWQYRELQNKPNSAKDDAEYFASFMMKLDQRVFGHNEFTITDPMLFRVGNNVPSKIKLLPVTADVHRNSLMMPVEYCQEVTVWFVDCTYIGHPACTPNCDQCPECMSYFQYDYCWTEWEEGGGGGGGGGETGGGGGSGSGGGSTPPYCVPLTVELIDPTGGGGGGGTGGNPCPPGWVLYVPPVGTTYAEYDHNVTDNDPDMQWYDDITTTFPPQPKPSWANVYANFPKKADGTEMCGEDVYNLVGGQVLAMMPSSRNACAVRVSRALLYSGVTIPNISGHTFQGADGKYYFLSAAKLYNWLKKTFGNPDVSLSGAQGGTNGQNFPGLLSGHKGIYMLRPNFPGQFKATGHSSLYTGTSCIGHDCPGADPNNGCYFGATGGVYEIAVWELN